MYTRRLWVDRLFDKLRKAQESAAMALPGLVEFDAEQIEQDLACAEVLVITQEVAERLIADGRAPEDLKISFDLPFDNVFFEFDPVACLPGETGRGIRGVLVTGLDGGYRVRAWFDERHGSGVPRYEFIMAPGVEVSEKEGRIADLLYWLAGYITSANVVAIRHNRRPETLKRHREAGRPTASSFYTFTGAETPRKPRVRRRLGEPKPRTTEVHGHFRRAHWHSLPFGRGKALYPTVWVRSHKRRIPEPHAEVSRAA
ncbi:MAG: hypothetical protein HYX78_06760 [Armatimonadetes bacterium]|nr:hypothetical protein [Armatimonadota bacterium]